MLIRITAIGGAVLVVAGAVLAIVAFANPPSLGPGAGIVLFLRGLPSHPAFDPGVRAASAPLVAGAILAGAGVLALVASVGLALRSAARLRRDTDGLV
jgi:hypothetical protein